MGDRGQIVVPATLRRSQGWSVGTRLHLLETDGGVVVMTTARLRDFVRGDWARSGRGLVEELLAERRAEADLDAGGAPS